MKDPVYYNADKVDGSMGMGAKTTLAQKNMSTLMMNNAAREARSMSSTQGPHNNRSNQTPYDGKSPAPRSG